MPWGRALKTLHEARLCPQELVPTSSPSQSTVPGLYNHTAVCLPVGLLKLCKWPLLHLPWPHQTSQQRGRWDWDQWSTDISQAIFFFLGSVSTCYPCGSSRRSPSKHLQRFGLLRNGMLCGALPWDSWAGKGRGEGGEWWVMKKKIKKGEESKTKGNTLCNLSAESLCSAGRLFGDVDWA